jgi:hypothetical protein
MLNLKARRCEFGGTVEVKELYVNGLKVGIIKYLNQASW